MIPIPRTLRRGTARPRPPRVRFALAAAVASLFLAPRGAVPAPPGPVETVRRFCLADARGSRLGPGSWSRVAPLVGWTLEPAWERVQLVSRYEIGAPRRESGRILVPVTWSVVATVGPEGVRREHREETRVLALAHDAGGAWRIAPPPPPPHVFHTQVDPERIHRLLAGTEGRYLSATAFVRRHWPAGAAHATEIRSLHDIPRAPSLREVVTPEAGAVVVYEDGGVPYHAGIVAAADRFRSATINRGIVVAPPEAFAGTRRYFAARKGR